ncbi:MAG: winged helix-turn-helix transcriptional regulator [Acidimicrobiaceae bacterium]|nr:winged helix-turn-helix transcriptional regulator [Acidimicrobiaceae bacterium]
MEDLVDNMCMALNDPKRLMVLWALREGPHSVGELSDLLESPPSNVSQHLAILRTRGLVDTERQGNSIYYHLRHPKIIVAIDLLREVLRDEIDRRSGIVASDSQDRGRTR